ncbi:bifunctional glutamate--cysteine ligase GshA/glutathione synthetase GshB [Jeotgalibaca sp. MA1X17-3]|uniref:bifunctional glutamate--cysteine ligase GshA/glutathione synthetase GshB n=1 Tax=Jeotgalibaca sp. MA1X17-3 TaxID=2908211 RepID=UPI002103524F|nr:bifunctional glutamate--cysteine ligase GshA/glutathione synthetase GshB [Jeotgalibaca sp. MA1X17-3]
MNIQAIIKENTWENLFMKGVFGLEKESQRINEKGIISKIEHPHQFGNRDFHPYVQTDFAEAQLELITPPVDSVEGTMQWLAAIHDVTLGTIPEEEYLLPLSVPVLMPEEEEIEIAKLDNPEDRKYREYLAAVYGKRKQMVSGIHYNFEFNQDFLNHVFQQQNEIEHYKDFQDKVYLKVAHNFLRYQWILTYLMGAAIEAEKEYFKDNVVPSDIPDGYIRSLRSSKYGYVNNDDVDVSFETLEDYVETIQAMVDEGKLIEEKEFYSTVRFRGGKNAKEILEKGIAYLEFRLFDLNPFAAYGILEEDMNFIHYFLMYMLWMDEDANESNREKGKEMNFVTAFESPLKPSTFKEEGIEILEGMKAMLVELGNDPARITTVDKKINAFEDPSQTLSGKMVEVIQTGGSLLEWGISKAKENKKIALEQPYSLTGFEDMELSTQILLFDAIQKGLKIEILDRKDQFISLKYKDHVEYIKNGNMTSKDTYIAPLIMENKVVTKKILADHGFSVPKSIEYENAEDAIKDYTLFREKSFVVKPKSTNFGLGINIFRNGASQENFEKAIEIAFQEDETVLLEDFVEGTEYRFFVIGDETKAVLLRVPANVQGDGIHSIEELVAIKNDNPLRGYNHRTPLEKIEMGATEKITLEEQGFNKEDIPAKGENVYLRDNSNVSTGGDSIDYTDQVDESYKEIAVGISKTLGANVSGIDMMIIDYKNPAESKEGNYGVIEANFNPMMMMHIYPYQGKSRRLTLDILALLFPEMKH